MPGEENGVDVAGRLVAALCGDSALSDLAVGEMLVREGDLADDVFVVQEGELEARRSTDGGDVTVGSIGAGQIVGQRTSARHPAEVRRSGPAHRRTRAG